MRPLALLALITLALAATAAAVDYQAEIEALYKKHNPSKVASVPGLLKKYKGNEEQLLKKIKEKYPDKDGEDEGDGDGEMEVADDSVEGQIRAIYKKHKPEKLDSVPALLKKYAGAEQKLLKTLMAKYEPEAEEEEDEEPEGEPAEPFSFDADSGVVELTDKMFNDTVKADRTNMWLLEFYAPWCGHCKSLKPEIETLGSALAGVDGVKVGACDATVHKKLAAQFKIEGFPVLGFMKRGRFIKYEGDRTAKMIANVLFKKAAGGKFLKPCVRDPLEVPDPEASMPEEWDEEDDGEWTAPMIRNPECKSQAKEAMGKIRVANGESETVPTKKKKPEKEPEEKAEPPPPPPATPPPPEPVKGVQLTEQAVLDACTAVTVIPSKIKDPEMPEPKDWDEEEDGPWQQPMVDNPVCEEVACGDNTPTRLCMVAFLPHILDSGAAGRNSAISMLEGVADKLQASDTASSTIRLVWAEGGQQKKMEAALEVSEFDYPALVVLSEKKLMAMKMMSAFDDRSIRKFVAGLQLGNTVVVPKPYKKEELGITTATSWDGKDGELPTDDSKDEL